MESRPPAARPRRRPTVDRPCLRAAVWGVVLLAAAAPVAAATAFRIYVEEAGAYRVTYEELRRSGLARGAVDPDNLALTSGGDEVPIRVDDGGDGRFGPGDRIEFVGRHLPGHRSYFSEHSLLNVYRLTVGGPGGRRMSSPPVPAAGAQRRAARLIVEEHLEKDRLKELLSGRAAEAPEVWYWTRLTHVDPEPFRQFLQLPGFRSALRRPVSLTVDLRGWSAAARRIEGMSDHRVEITLNGTLVGAGEWDGETPHRIAAQAPAELVRPGRNVLEIQVPARLPPVRRPPERQPPEATGEPIIDAVALNWIEVRYPRSPRLGHEAERLALAPRARGARRVRLVTAAGDPLVVYGAEGSRFDTDNMTLGEGGDRVFYDLYPPAGESVLWAVPGGTLRAPVAVELDRPSDLRDPARRADYIMIVHPRLRPAIEPLATFHRRRGLEVTVVEVDDVYDEFSHSIVDPAAIRDFLSHAYHRWQAPAPRFVLLVGDAGWKPEKSLFASEAAAEGEPATDSRRNLIPAGVFEGVKGMAASDNYFVSVAGDDHLPDLAIGRFPATEPAAVEAMVRKTLRYAAEPVIGPWRREILWVSSGDSFMQGRSNQAAGSVTERGFDLRKLYPRTRVEINRQSQEGLQQALDRGQLLVHFLGHGGRYVWRTGITDLETKLDLFTVDHLDQMAPNPRLPVFLSMTCYTASFNHPTADSFAERLLHLDGRGAVAFLGASWKVSPVARWSRLLLEELTSGGTLGEAIQRAKQRMKARVLVEAYNLLGDPALELALPQLEVEITARGGADEGWEIAATVPRKRFAGRAIVDWLDGDGEVIRSDEIEVRKAALTATGPPDREAVESVRVYVWSVKAGVDGMGALRLAGDRPPPDRAGRG